MTFGTVEFLSDHQVCRQGNVRALDTTQLSFEIYEGGARDVLRAVLSSCVESCIEAWSRVRSLGFASTPTILNKFPYHKTALRRPTQVTFNPSLEWLLAAQNRPRSPVPESSRPRPRPRYWRDGFGPGVVLPLNIFLGWLLINADLVNIRL